MSKLSIFFILFRRWHSEEGWWGFGCCPTTVSRQPTTRRDTRKWLGDRAGDPSGRLLIDDQGRERIIRQDQSGPLMSPTVQIAGAGYDPESWKRGRTAAL